MNINLHKRILKINELHNQNLNLSLKINSNNSQFIKQYIITLALLTIKNK